MKRQAKKHDDKADDLKLIRKEIKKEDLKISKKIKKIKKIKNETRN